MPNLNLKNFAKIKDSNFDINDITVFAGKPGTGKSFIMKFLYAETEAIHSIISGNYVKHYALADSKEHESSMLNFLQYRFPKKENNRYKNINTFIQTNDYIGAYEVFKEEFPLIENENPALNLIQTILKKYSEKQEKAFTDTEEDRFHFIFRNILENIFVDINQINESFSYESSNLKLTFDDDKLNIENANISDDNDGALFVETPLILEFQKFLPTEPFKVPYHIGSLLQELNKNDFTFTSEESNNFINEFIKSTATVINGNISKNATDFAFVSHNGKTYNIVNASSGIKSIGLLQYLVKNRAIKKGSTLYWEEPEVHLHPTWQLKMVELFIELMNAGVKIVFSTHSPYMADFLNAISTKQDFRNRVSFNLLNETDGIVSNTILNEENWQNLQKELLGPLEDIMWQYL